MYIQISIVPAVIAWFEEMHAMVTVWHGVLSEKPAPRAAWWMEPQQEIISDSFYF